MEKDTQDIDRYLLDEMTSAEKSEFEERLEHDPELRRMLEAQSSVHEMQQDDASLHIDSVHTGNTKGNTAIPHSFLGSDYTILVIIATALMAMVLYFIIKN